MGNPIPHCVCQVAAALCDMELDALRCADKPHAAARPPQSTRTATASAFRWEKAGVVQDCARACRQRARQCKEA